VGRESQVETIACVGWEGVPDQGHAPSHSRQFLLSAKQLGDRRSPDSNMGLQYYPLPVPLGAYNSI
jgi:hypothetical protein